MTGRAVLALLRRDVVLAVRIGGGALTAGLFFLVLVSVVPFAVGPDMGLLARIGPAVLWIGALLASLLGLDRLFQADHEDGSLDILTTAALPLEAVVAVKVAAHWLTTGLPLAVAAPLLAPLVNLGPAEAVSVGVSLLVGTPALAFIGAVGAALTVSLRRGGLLVPVLVLPLAVPVLIFGVAAANAAGAASGSALTPILILAALSLSMAVLGTISAAAALRSRD